MQAHLPCLRRRGLTLPSRGRPTSGFASCRPPLMSNVRAHERMNIGEARAIVEASLSRPTSTPNTSDLPEAVFLDAEKAKLRSKLIEPFEVVAEPGTW